MVRAAALTVLLAIGAPASGQSQPSIHTGNGLLAICDSANVYDQGTCTDYIMGVLEGLRNLGSISADAPKFCTGERVTYQQSIDVVKAYLRNNPQRRDITSAFLILAAMRDAFPCAPQQ